MDLNQLKNFQSIARNENISQAARNQFVSPQAAGQMLRQLEKELGVELFDRSGKHLHLNHNGEILLHYADVAENAIMDAETSIKERKEARERTVRIILRTPLGDTAQLVSSFIDENPEYIPHIATSNEVADDFDVELLLYTEEVPDNNAEYICEEKTMLLVPSNHPLAQQDSPIDIKELRDESIAIFQQDAADSQFERLCRYAGFKPRYTFVAQQVESILNFIEHGHGISVGSVVTWLNAKNSGITALPINGYKKEGKLYVRVDGTTPSKGAKKFARRLRDHLQASALRNLPA